MTADVRLDAARAFLAAREAHWAVVRNSPSSDRADEWAAWHKNTVRPALRELERAEKRFQDSLGGVLPWIARELVAAADCDETPTPAAAAAAAE